MDPLSVTPSANSVQTTFSTGGCGSADNDPISFSVDVTTEGVPGSWTGLQSSYICLDSNKQWDPGYGCCWTTTGNSCGSSNDCCGTNTCSNGYCCPENYYWDGSQCSSASDTDSGLCSSLGGTWDVSDTFTWTNGIPQCALPSGNEYVRTEDYYLSTMPDGAVV